MKTLIVGMGEVGSALYEVLSPHYEVHCKDIEERDIPPGIEILHICIRHSDRFRDIVMGYAADHLPRLINICSTVPPGTTESILGRCVHSTTRGLHPHLAAGMRTIIKHVGGPEAVAVAEYFEGAGIACVTHERATTTEVAHLIANTAYGISLMFADEAAAICRRFGVDYVEAVIEYTQSHNDGFAALGHAGKCRPVLTPPNGYIGGHCVVQAARMLAAAGVGGGQVGMLAGYNEAGERKRQ